MTTRHVVLGAGAAGVLGACVYLFLEVRKPASAQASSTDHVVASRDPEPGPESHPTTTPTTTPTRSANLPAMVAGATPTTATGPTEAPQLDEKLEFKLDQVMAEANKAYDRMDFDEARSIAQRVLTKYPTNTRMLRIMVSAACIEADPAEAQKHYVKLPPSDRASMRIRCKKYDVTFTEP